MLFAYQTLRRLKNRFFFLQWIHARTISLFALFQKKDELYQVRLEQETEAYKHVEDINVLPEIFHYWSHKYVRPMLEEYGASNPEQFFAKYLRVGADRCKDEAPTFLSVGAGNCDTEIRIARLMKDAGLEKFVIECLDMNPHTLQRGKEMAERECLIEHFEFRQADFNKWKSTKKYAGVMANQSLHHVMNLEGLLDEVRQALHPFGYFVTSDMIGRNGHQRWPEALIEVHRFWNELPKEYKYNAQLSRHEEMYENWDCSTSGFEGIRSQDILPLIIDRFKFRIFIGFGNVIDIFVDRGFGHNFRIDKSWDTSFIDRIHAFDEEQLKAGSLTPTHIMAVMTMQDDEMAQYSRGLQPETCVRTS